jgi:BlaI family transcriptional regulator, penicillinase repressor
MIPSPKRDSSNPCPSISDAEWVVMKVVWRRGAATANQVVSDLAARAVWKPKTIHTLLRRLVEKKALVFDKVGREFEYRPRVDEAQCTLSAARSFLDRFFEGQLAPFLSCFLDREKLSPEELRELRRILNEKAP